MKFWMEISFVLAYGVPPHSFPADANQTGWQYFFNMCSEVSIKILKTQGLWLIALLCLALNLPVVYMLPTKGGASLFELTAHTFEAVLQGSPGGETLNREHLKQHPETEMVSPIVFPASQMPQCSVGLLPILIIPHWITHHHPLSLPRPPPLSWIFR